MDGDGHGFQCEQGEDCDDTDATLFEGCSSCGAKPAEGCACDDDAPVDCTLPKELTSTGSLLCKAGTRYCRDGLWSACEGIKSFEAPPPSRVLAQGIIQSDAAPVICDACNPDCYRIEDTFTQTDAGYGNNVVSGNTGGITLSSHYVGEAGVGEAGYVNADAGLLGNPSNCVPGTAPDFDCDGIPDAYDTYPGAPPFASDHNTIFMDLAPGQAKSQSFEIRFYLNTADIYLYMDMTGSMDGERTNLISSLRTGNFLANGGADITCADRNFNNDTSDEEHLKNEGVAGNLACLIRDSRLGAGWHRDLPFATPDTRGFAFGPHDFEVFQHEQDITNDVQAVLNGLNRFVTRGGINRPEGGILGLYALATGAEMYMGWDRPGNPPRTTCPAGTWGYACFRDDAVPIVIWMTDAPLTNGPDTTQGHLGYTSQGNQWGVSANQLLNWDAQSLRIAQGSDPHYTQVTGNEAFATAYDVGDINKSLRTFTGNTTGMASDVTYASFGGCGATFTSSGAWLSSQQTAPDAVFKFDVTENEPITVSLRGSRFNTALAIVDATRLTAPFSNTAISNNVNPSTAYSAGTLAVPAFANVTGSTTNTGAVFTRDSMGTCLTGTGASDKIGASVIKFNLAQDATQLRITSDGNYNLATSVFAGQPMTPTDVDLTTQTTTVGTATLTGNANDYFEDYTINPVAVDGTYRRFTGGNLADTDLTANFAPEYFTCGADGRAKDAVFDFSVNARRRVRIEGVGNNSNLTASLEHVMQLVKRPSGTAAPIVSPVANNTSDATAHIINAAAIPTDPNAVLQYTGNFATSTATAGLRAEYYNSTDFTNLVLSRVDSTVNNNWGTGSPDSAVPADNFSVRWTGFVTPLYSQAYTFYTQSDDGVRLWVNEQLIINNWTLHGSTENSGTTVALTAGVPVSIRMEYYEGGGDAVAQLSWSSTSQTKQIIPSTQLSTGAAQFSYLQTEVGPNGPTSATDCTNSAAAATSLGQAVFAIDVPSTTTYDIDTLGSTTQAWLSHHVGNADTQIAVTPTNANVNVVSGVHTQQELGMVDERSLLINGGSLGGHAASTDYIMTGTLGCGGTSVTGGRDAVYTFSVQSPQTVRASVITSNGTILANGTGPAFNSYIFVYRNSIAAANLVGGGCTDAPSTNASDSGDIAVTPGNTYYIVVKQVTVSSTSISYGLWLRDTTYDTHYQVCDYGSHPNSAAAFNVAKLTRTLAAGRHYFVVKGTSGGAYKLNIRRTQPLPTVQACARSSSLRSAIETDLDPGNYSVIIRGYAAGSTGTYNLIVRDMSAAPAPLACVYDPNGTTPNSVVLNNLPARNSGGVPIDYYVVMRGNTSAAAYSVRMDVGRDFPNTTCKYDNCTFTEPTTVLSAQTTDVNNAEFKGTLPIGTYYAVVKGYDNTQASLAKANLDWGMYQFTIGDETNYQTYGTFDAKRWLGPAGDGVGGIREALNNRQVRVITVDSTTGSGDDATYSDQQMRTVAQATDAVSLSGSPLFFKINSNGTGLGATIVDAVNTLAGNLAMDVGVRLVEAVDMPAGKHFKFVVKAIDVAGDLCKPPIDADNDEPNHFPDTHIDCTPGAVPRFQVTIENPVDNPVPWNTNNPQGGYDMRIDLIGDGQYVVDSIPVFIIPEDVVEEPGDNRYDPSGTYEQTISATGCVGNEAPVWRTLGWDAAIPEGTKITWNVCTADTTSALASCTLQQAAAVTTRGICMNDGNCPGGYCNTQGMCEFVEGPSCASSDECGVNGVCNSTTHKCNWTDNPIDVKPALMRSLQGKKNARVQVIMESNFTHTKAPTINTWGLKYTCTAQE